MTATELFVIEPGLWQAADPVEVAATCAALHELGLYRLPYEQVTMRLRGKDIVQVRNPSGRTLEDLDEFNRPKSDHLYIDTTISAEPNTPVKIVAYNALSQCTNDVSDLITVTSTQLELGQIREAQRLLYEKTGEAHEAVVFDYGCNGDLGIDKETLRANLCNFLIAMLATRNAVKERREDKLAKLGIGKRKYKHRFRYTTTISLPRDSEMESDPDHPPGKGKAPHLRRGHIRRNQRYGPKNAFVRAVWIAPVFVNADPDFVSERGAYNVTTKMQLPEPQP